MMDYGSLNMSGPTRARSSVLNRRPSIARAFSLVEVFVVIVVLPFVMVAIAGLFRTFIRDIPQMTRLVQQNTTVQNLLDQMHRDVDEAVALPTQFKDAHANETLLLIEQSRGVVSYRLEEGRVVRAVLGEQGGNERVWSARDAVIDWRPWTQDGRTYAVEVHSYLKQRVQGHLMRRFENSYVFFAHGLSEGVDIQ